MILLGVSYLLEKICRKFRNLKQTADPIITSTLRYITITKQLITLITMEVLKLKFSSISASSCPQRPQWLSRPKAVHPAETCRSHNCMSHQKRRTYPNSQHHVLFYVAHVKTTRIYGLVE